ncbi:MAG: Fe-S-containing protein [Anaerolineae bacterium]
MISADCTNGSGRRAGRPTHRRPRAMSFLLALVFVLVSTAALSGCGAAAAASQAVTPVSGSNGVVSLPATDISGTARFYTYQAGPTAVRFFVLQSSDGVIRAALDACDVCYGAKLGYHQEGDEMVCNNCGTRFPSVQVNEVQGGCNPSPLGRTMTEGFVTITETDLVAGARLF